MKHLKSLAPYVLVELLMPGGRLLALSLYLYRRGRENLSSQNCRILPAPFDHPSA